MLCVFVCIVTCFFLCKRRKGEMYLELNSNIRNMFSYLNIENCEIIKLADYKNIHEKLAPIEVSKRDLEDRIKEILDTYGQKSVSLEFIEKEFGINTIKEFYELEKKKIIEEREVEELVLTRNNIMDNLIKNSTFSLDINNVAEYSLEIVEANLNEALCYGMELESYIREEMQMSEEEFFEISYEEGEEYIKTYLVVRLMQ